MIRTLKGWLRDLRKVWWNARARLRGEDTCEICDDTRGGVIGNGQYIEGVLMCDYCTCDERTNPGFWKKQPAEFAKDV